MDTNFDPHQHGGVPPQSFPTLRRSRVMAPHVSTTPIWVFAYIESRPFGVHFMAALALWKSKLITEHNHGNTRKLNRHLFGRNAGSVVGQQSNGENREGHVRHSARSPT